MRVIVRPWMRIHRFVVTFNSVIFKVEAQYYVGQWLGFCATHRIVFRIVW